MGAIGVITTLIGLLPEAVKLTSQVIAIKDQVQAIAGSGRDPTDAEWNQLNANLASLKAELDKDPV